jgi:DNA-directed RNA polymerase beta subunit
MKLTGPRKLHTSQYGYFCTSETPTGASIGITKNLTIMAAISTATAATDFLEWLRKRGNVYQATDLTLDQRIAFVPVYVNGGMFGYTARASLLTKVCKLLKRTGCLPYSASITFSVRDRCVYIYLDEGRPMRPLIWLNESGDSRMNVAKLAGFKKWRDLVMGNLAAVANKELDNTDFTDPQKDIEAPKLESYISLLEPHTGVIEYIDPYEQNEAYIANYPDYIKDETTHVEVHPSTILSLMTSQIPFPQHNQSPRNQLSCSQSKQGVSYYATNWSNRFDNTAHVLCYGEAPLTRSMYTNYLGEGKMP